MSATTLSNRSYRPRSLPPGAEAKIAVAKAHLAKRDRIARIRDGLQSLIRTGERERERRRIAGDGNEPPQLLIDVLAIETDFDLLVAENLK